MPEAFFHHLMEIPSFRRIQGRYSMFLQLFPEANERVCPYVWRYTWQFLGGVREIAEGDYYICNLLGYNAA
jgi:hypothetical protein